MNLIGKKPAPETRKIKAVIFDMGGVLLRTMDPQPRIGLAREFSTTREELEKVVFHSESSKASEVGQLSDEEHWASVFKHFGVKFEDYLDAYDRFFAGDRIDQRLIDFIRSISKKVKTGMLSNAWVNARRLLSERYDFMDVFDVSIFSYEIGERKPSREIFEIMLERLDVSAEESIFVDDFQENVAGAKELGIHAIHFQSAEQIIASVEQWLD